MNLLKELYFSDRAPNEEPNAKPAAELSISTVEPSLDDHEQLSPKVADWQAQCKANYPDCQFKRYGDMAPTSPYANMYIAYGLNGGAYNYYGLANDDNVHELDSPAPIEAGTLASMMPDFDGAFVGGEEEETLMRAMDYHCKGAIK